MLYLQYKTDHDAVEALLPDCFKPADEPTVTIAYAFNDGVDFLLGRGYNVVIVLLAAKFLGEKDRLEGDYVLVIFENATHPIITGREILGAPKIFADIPSPEILQDGSYRCEAHLWGHLLFGVEFGQMKKQNMIVRKMGEKMANRRPWMTYKYISSLEREPDASYPIANWSDSTIDDLWLGKSGSIYFGEAGEEDIGLFKSIIDAIDSLPVLEISQVSHWKGSQIMRLDRSRRIQ
jgi:acetoacetate decarboxylase